MCRCRVGVTDEVPISVVPSVQVAPSTCTCISSVLQEIRLSRTEGTTSFRTTKATAKKKHIEEKKAGADQQTSQDSTSSTRGAHLPLWDWPARDERRGRHEAGRQKRQKGHGRCARREGIRALERQRSGNPSTPYRTLYGRRKHTKYKYVVLRAERRVEEAPTNKQKPCKTSHVQRRNGGESARAGLWAKDKNGRCKTKQQRKPTNQTDVS